MKVVQLCKAVADEARARMLSILIGRELNVGEIVEVLGMSQPRVSRHLKVLGDSGLVTARRDGRRTFYMASEGEPGLTLIKAFSSLLDGDDIFRMDLRRAEQVVAARAAQTREFFDSIAMDWTGLRKEVLGELDLNAEIVGRLPRIDTVADLGCGPGDLLASLMAKADHGIGVDSAPRMLEVAEKRFADRRNVSLRIGELEHLPLRDWEADVAVLSMVLHHLADPAKALAEAARTIKFGGRLLVAEFDLHDNEVMRERFGDHRLGFDREQMCSLLEAAGFTVRDVESFAVNLGLTVNLFIAVKS